HGTDAVWWIAAALCVAGAVLGTRTPAGGTGAPATNRRLLHQSALAPGTVLLLAITGLAAFQTFVALHVEDLGMDDAAGVYLTYSVLVLVVRVFFAQVPDRFGAERVAGIGILLGGVGLLVTAVATGPVGLFAGTAVMAVGLSP